MNIGCEPNKRRALAFAMGAFANASQLDIVLPLPRGIHWAASGAASILVCDGKKAQPKADTLVMDAVIGYAGGWAFSYLKRVF